MSPSRLRNFQKNTTHKKFLANWSTGHEFAQSKDSINELIESLRKLEENNTFQDEVIILTALKEFKPLYATPNVEKLFGYTAEEFIAMGSFAFQKIISNEHINFLPDLAKSEGLTKEYNRIKKMMPTMGEGYFIGKKIITKGQEEKRILVRQKIALGPNYKLPVANLFYYSDITHLLKTDDYWFLFKSINGIEKLHRFYKYGSEEKILNTVISEREREILDWVIKGKSSKEISVELEISQGTVEKHRKNMIARLGVRDTSSLIQICKFCELI